MSLVSALPLACFSVIVAVSMMIPGLQPPFGVPNEIAHVMAFFAISLGCMTLIRASGKVVLLGLFALAFGLEGVQFFIPQRSPEFVDVMCNLFGVALSYYLVSVVKFLKRPVVAYQLQRFFKKVMA